MFQMKWNSGDVTWMPYYQIQHLDALEAYLELQGVRKIQNLPAGTALDSSQVRTKSPVSQSNPPNHHSPEMTSSTPESVPQIIAANLIGAVLASDSRSRPKVRTEQPNRTCRACVPVDHDSPCPSRPVFDGKKTDQSQISKNASSLRVITVNHVSNPTRKRIRRTHLIHRSRKRATSSTSSPTNHTLIENSLIAIKSQVRRDNTVEHNTRLTHIPKDEFRHASRPQSSSLEQSGSLRKPLEGVCGEYVTVT